MAHVRGKVGKSRRTVFVQSVVAPESRKSRLAKAAGVEPCAEMRGENVRAVVVRSRGIQEGSRRHKHVTSGGVLGVHWLKTCKALGHELHVREKVGKSPKVFVFPIFWGSGRSKSMLAEAVGAEPFGEMRGGKTWTLLR